MTPKEREEITIYIDCIDEAINSNYLPEALSLIKEFREVIKDE